MKKKELLEMITNGQNSGVEFKLDNIRPEQLAKEVVALANLKGGHILLGVADDKSIVGITRENLSEWVADTVFARYVHPMILPYYQEIVVEDGKRVAVITIGQEVSKPYVVRANDRETAYVRIGSVSRPATREQLLMLGSASGMVHTEIMPVHRSSFESLDLARLENYLRDILKDPEVPESRSAWITRPKALGLMVDGVTEEPVCTIAALVLFGIKPRQFAQAIGVASDVLCRFGQSVPGTDGQNTGCTTGRPFSGWKSGQESDRHWIDREGVGVDRAFCNAGIPCH